MEYLYLNVLGYVGEEHKAVSWGPHFTLCATDLHQVGDI